MNSLVSVIVLSYNSSKFISETLESIRKQTYDNIELIIADDCSTDDTVFVCRRWIKHNRNRFKRSILIDSKCNTGVSANVNRGVCEAKGEWIKIIAGDDRLMPYCISDYVNYVKLHPETDFLFSNVFKIDENGVPLIEDSTLINVDAFNSLSVDDIKILIFISNILPAPTSFIKKDTLLEMGLFDERFPMKEDYPLWLKAASEERVIKMLNHNTVEYRIHDKSISSKVNKTLMTDNDYLFQNLRSGYLRRISWFLWYLGYTSFCLNKTNMVLYKVLYSINKLNPYYYRFSSIFKRIKKET